MADEKQKDDAELTKEEAGTQLAKLWSSADIPGFAKYLKKVSNIKSIDLDWVLNKKTYGQ